MEGIVTENRILRQKLQFETEKAQLIKEESEEKDKELEQRQKKSQDLLQEIDRLHEEMNVKNLQIRQTNKMMEELQSSYMKELQSLYMKEHEKIMGY